MVIKPIKPSSSLMVRKRILSCSGWMKECNKYWDRERKRDGETGEKRSQREKSARKRAVELNSQQAKSG